MKCSINAFSLILVVGWDLKRLRRFSGFSLGLGLGLGKEFSA